MEYKIIIADDKESVLDNFRVKLQNHLDIEPVFTRRASEVIDLVRDEPFGYAVVVLDFHFDCQELTGAEVARKLLSINPKLIIMVCTGDLTSSVPIECLQAGVRDFVQKDEPLDEIVKKIRLNCKKFDEIARVVGRTTDRGQFAENAALIRKIGMVGRSNSMAELAKKIIQLSENGGNDATVLVRGETGTGKELVASAIHELSTRKSRPFVCVNCAAIPENLLESELFGHEKGAFTGAERKKLGKFQVAMDGTIFLDEIGEMPKPLQAKLLRVLQEKVIEPVGSTRPVAVNVRVIAATHVNLEEQVSAGEFREDLYYRLNKIPLFISPLRERSEDVEPLVIHFQEKHGSRASSKRILYKTLRYMREYCWEGNVRQLENHIERLMIMTPGDEIRPEHLDANIFNASAMFEELASYPKFREKMEELLEEREKSFILSKIRGAKSLRSAAREISIPNTSLQEKLSSWGYSVPEALGQV